MAHNPTTGTNRVLLGRAPANTTNPFYTRTDEVGLFVSVPGSNVMNCNDGSLMFDSRANGVLQILGSGFTVVPGASSTELPWGASSYSGEISLEGVGSKTIETGIASTVHPVPNSPMMAWINYQDIEGTHITNWPNVHIPNAFFSTSGGSVRATVYANTVETIGAQATNAYIVIKFTNGQVEPMGVYWTLFKEPGATSYIEEE